MVRRQAVNNDRQFWICMTGHSNRTRGWGLNRHGQFDDDESERDDIRPDIWPNSPGEKRFIIAWSGDQL
jgi:hypothetical protein